MPRASKVHTLLLNACIIAGVTASSTAQTLPAPHPLPDAQVMRLPPAYQEQARKLITGWEPYRNVFGEISDTEWTGLAFGMLTQLPEGTEFLRAQLEKESSGQVRMQLITALEQYFAQHPQDQAILEKLISSDPDPAAALAALEALRRIKEIPLREALGNRIKTADASDKDAAKKFRDVYLAHYMWYGDVRVPRFAYMPPPVFQVKPRGFVRVLAFGDLAWGSGNAQAKTAAAMLTYHRALPFDFGITLGDNFYGRGPLVFADRAGLSSPYDPRWQTEWEQRYDPLGIKFYPAIGNADYIDPDGPAAELAYAKMSQSWVFPAFYYTYTAGSVQFFSIDDIRLSDDELQWLDEELAKSKARWKVVYAHYHIRSATDGDTEELVNRLLPILKKHSVDVWMNGHLHEMQEIEPEGSLHFFVSGGGGAPLSGMSPTYKRSKFREARHGFSVIEADDEHFDVIFVNDDGQEMHRAHIVK